jgi:hypothetical protein
MKQQQGTSPDNGCARGRPKTSQVLLTFRQSDEVALDVRFGCCHINKVSFRPIRHPDRKNPRAVKQ